MMRPIVLLDCDGPMANFTKAYLRAVEQETGEVIFVDEIDQWSIHQTAAFRRAVQRCPPDYDPFDVRKRVEVRVSRPGFCSQIEVQPGARASVDTLTQLAEVFVVTSPWNSCPTWTHEREAWLWDHFGIPSKRVIHTSAKARVHGDLLLDDNAGHVRAWSGQWANGTAVLHSLPSNQNDGEGLTRGGWMDVIEAVTKRMAA